MAPIRSSIKLRAGIEAPTAYVIEGEKVLAMGLGKDKDVTAM